MQRRISNSKCAAPRQLICSVQLLPLSSWKRFYHPSPKRRSSIPLRQPLAISLLCLCILDISHGQSHVIFTIFLASSPCSACYLMPCLTLVFTVWSSAFLPVLSMPAFVHLPDSGVSYSHCSWLPPSVTLTVGFAMAPLVTLIFWRQAFYITLAVL